MRNLKKILALVLALVMSLSLVTVANAAVDFDDAAEIDSKEAVDLMTAIGVIDGMDGSFNPEGTLTREQAAKIVAYMLLGDKADKLGATDTGFADVATTRWSAPYIAYCASLGILDGAGDGNFYPAGQLTGYAFAKMLLCAVGYGVNKEYTGANWMLNVARDGIKIDLFDGALVEDAPISRDNAVQIAFNALKADLVAYNELFKTYSAQNGYGSQTLLGTLAWNVFGVAKNATKVDDYGFNAAAWKKGTKVITDYYVTDTIVATVSDPATTAGALLNSYSWDSAAASYVNANSTDGDANIDGTLAGDVTAKPIANGEVWYLVDVPTGTPAAKDGDIDKVLIVKEYLAKVTGVTAATAYAKRTIDLTVYDGADSDGTNITVKSDSFAKNDYVLYIPQNNTVANDSLTALKAAESFTGTVTAYYPDADGSVTVNGTKYEYNAIMGNNGLGNAKIASGQYTLNTATYKFFLDSNGYVIGIDTVSDSIANYAYIIAVGEDAYELKNTVKVLLSDGTIAEYAISSKSADSAEDNGNSDSDIADVGAIYAYSMDGAKIVLTEVASVNSAYTLDITNGTINAFTKTLSSIKYSTSSYAYANDKTVFVYLVNGEVKGMYVGKDNAPTISANKVASMVTKNDTVRDWAEFVVITEAADAATTGSYVYAIDTSVFGQAKVGTTELKYYSVIKDGEAVKIAVDANSDFGGNGAYLYTYDAAAFNGDTTNTVEAGVYKIGSAVDAANQDQVTVSVNSESNVLVATDNTQYAIEPTTVIVDLTGETPKFNAEYAKDDVVIVVFETTNSINYAETIYIIG